MIFTELGQRMPWYVAGFIIFLIGYFPTYQNIRQLVPGISESGEAGYYITSMCVVNIGWAAVQIGHMSLVPSLTYSIKRRVNRFLELRIASITLETPLHFCQI